MRGTVRHFQTVVAGDPGAMDWGVRGLVSMERNADLVRVYLPG
jgi:hypothetical protein